MSQAWHEATIITQSWHEAVDAHVRSIEEECKADHKAFYNVNEGRERVRGAIGSLRSFIARLEAMNRGA